MKLITDSNLELIIQRFYERLLEEFPSLTVENANKLTQGRTLTIGETGKVFDGSQDVFWSLNEIGAVSKGTISDLNTSNKTVVGAINELQNNKASVSYVNNAIENVTIDDAVTAVELIGNVEDVEFDFVTQEELEDALANLDDIDIEGMVTAVDVGNVDIEQGGSNNGGSFDLSSITMYDIKAYIDDETATVGSEIDGLWECYNELFQSANNGKELIASAIGEPLNAEDTFSAMSNDINGLLSTFKTNMMNNGITVESNDKFKALIDKIATITGDSGNKGVQFTTGSGFWKAEKNSSKIVNLTIPTNLDFNPTIVICNVSYASLYVGTSIEDTFINAFVSNTTPLKHAIYTEGQEAIKMTNFSANSFTLTTAAWKTQYGGSSQDAYINSLEVVEWIAIGVGEEDTALRDSLASILQEEGVSVTEEDNMTSLITKVDTKLDEITSNKNRLYNLMLEGGYEVNSSMDLDSLLDLLELSKISVSDIKQIACGEYHTIALKNDGTVWSCGYNNYGQLGLNDTTSRTTFTKVTANINNDVKQIACGGYHTIIVKNDGSVWSCGRNTEGQLGLGHNTNLNYFAKVATNINNDAKQVACGYLHTIIVKNDGSLWSCGYNSNGQLGLNDTTDRTTFTKATTNINNDIKQIACGQYYTVILKTDGSVYSCGHNNYGQLGLNNNTDCSTFTKVTTNINNDVKQISCGIVHTFILKNDGSIYSCGRNANGQLGLGNTTAKTTFTKVTAISNNVKQVVCGYYHTIIVRSDGSIYSCGLNDKGQLGLNNTTDRTAFTKVTTNINNDVKQISCGGLHTFILKNNDSIYSCGQNNFGQLGLNDTDNKIIFTDVPRGF